MSALSVMSLIAPTVPVGANAASVDTAADEALFAGLMAAVSAPMKGASEGEAATDVAPIESDAVEAPSLDVAADTAPAWPPLPLIAPVAPSVVSPIIPDAAVESADSANASAPVPSATPENAAPEASQTPSPTPSKVDDAAAPASPNLTMATSAASDLAPEIAKAPAAPVASSLSDAAPTEPRMTPSRLVAAGQETVAAPVASDGPVEGEFKAPTARPAPPTAAATPASQTAVVATPSISKEAVAPRQAESATVAPAPPAKLSAPAPVAAPAVPPAVPGPAPERPAPEPATVPTAAAEPAVSPLPASVTASITVPAPRPAPPPVAAQLATPPVSQPAPDADAPEPVVAAAVVSTETEAEAAPETQPPAVAASAPAPSRNGSARLDERRSNAATANAPVEARTETSTAGRSFLSASTPSTAPVAAATAALNDAVGPAPVPPADAAPLDAPADLAPSQQLLDAQTAAPTAQRDLGLSQLSRATVETTAQLAAQIIRKLEGRSTRFDMALTPEGLGRVDVSLEIDSDGRLAARLAFDNPAAATDLRARADELRRQLQDAGFQLTQDSLEFSERNPSSGFSGGGAFDRAPDRRAFAGAARLAAQADTALPPPGPWASLSLTPDRVDMKV